MRDDTFDVSKLGNHNTQNSLFFALGVAFLRLRPRFTMVYHTSKSHGSIELRPIANKNGPCLWQLVRRCGKGRKLRRVEARLFGDFDRKISKPWDSWTTYFSDFFRNRLTPRFFFRNPSSKVLRKKVARINPSWDKAMFHCHRAAICQFDPDGSLWNFCVNAEVGHARIVWHLESTKVCCAYAVFQWPWIRFMYVDMPCMEDVNESEKIRYTVGQFTHHGDRSATSGASRGAAGRPSGGTIAASSSKLEILTDSDWQIWPMVQWFLYSFHTVRWKPSFLRILFELAATETTSRRVQGHLGLRRQERTKNMSCCFSLPFECTSLPGFLWKIMGKRQSPMAYHHSPIKHCYFLGGISIFSHNFWAFVLSKRLPGQPLGPFERAWLRVFCDPVASFKCHARRMIEDDAMKAYSMFWLCLVRSLYPFWVSVKSVKWDRRTAHVPRTNYWIASINSGRMEALPGRIRPSDRSLATSKGFISNERGTKPTKPDRAFAIDGDFDVSF